MRIRRDIRMLHARAAPRRDDEVAIDGDFKNCMNLDIVDYAVFRPRCTTCPPSCARLHAMTGGCRARTSTDRAWASDIRGQVRTHKHPMQATCFQCLVALETSVVW